MSARYVVGEHPEKGRLYACADPAVRFTDGRVEPSRLGAMLAPFPDIEAATAALVAAGAEVEGVAA